MEILQFYIIWKLIFEEAQTESTQFKWLKGNHNIIVNKQLNGNSNKRLPNIWRQNDQSVFTGSDGPDTPNNTPPDKPAIFSLEPVVMFWRILD